jgi:hypothetical protein
MKGQRHGLLPVESVTAPDQGLEPRTEAFEQPAASRREVVGPGLRRRRLPVEGAQQGGGVFVVTKALEQRDEVSQRHALMGPVVSTMPMVNCLLEGRNRLGRIAVARLQGGQRDETDALGQWVAYGPGVAKGSLEERSSPLRARVQEELSLDEVSPAKRHGRPRRFRGSTQTWHRGKCSLHIPAVALGESEVEEWARRIGQWRRRAEIYVYFNNDWEGFAINNARSLKRRLGLA